MLSTLVICMFVLVHGHLVESHSTSEVAYGNTSYEKTLFDHLQIGYDPSARPVLKQDKTIQVQYGMTLTNIVDVDLKTHSISLNVWSKQAWTDELLHWQPKSFGNLSQINIPIDKIWSPDITEFNSMGDTAEDTIRIAIVYPSGYVIYVPHRRIRTHCELDLSNFPYDKQTCLLRYGSWTYSGNKVNITHFQGQDTIDLSSYTAHHEWNITSVSAKREDKYYPCCPGVNYPSITYTLNLQRLTTYYTYVFTTPCVMLALLMPTVFLLAPESKQKIPLAIGLFICLTLLLLMLELLLPAAFNGVPKIGLYYVANMVMLSITIFLNILTMNCWLNAARKSSPLPSFLRTIFFSLFGRLFCIDREAYNLPSHDAALQMAAAPEGHDAENQSYNDRYNVLTAPRLKDAVFGEYRALAMVLDRLLCGIFLIINIILAVAVLG